MTRVAKVLRTLTLTEGVQNLRLNNVVASSDSSSLSAHEGVMEMKHPRRQQIMHISLAGASSHATLQPGARCFSRLVTLWVPTDLANFGHHNITAVLDDVNAKIVERGYIEPDGQMLMSPITPGGNIQMVDVWGCSSESDRMNMSRLYQKGLIAGVVEDSDNKSVLDVDLRMWGPEQQRYFGRESPYQLCEEPQRYSLWHVELRHNAPYLSVDERIVALLHGIREDQYFYCPCHSASVVYTTRNRLICMGCGFLHAVPESPLRTTGRTLLTDKEWQEYFDPDGSKAEQYVDLALLDFQEVENTRMIWTTSQWEEACSRFVFFSRSSPAEINAAIRGTEMDQSIFLNSGWQPESMLPPVAHQVVADSVDVDLVENAMNSLMEGVHFYIAARYDSSLLVTAIPALFRSIELLLKERLVRSDSNALADQPNNPSVIARLKVHGVAFNGGEEAAIGTLRRLRNSLQHGTATFNQRVGLSACREAVVFLNRFLDTELNIFIGDGICDRDWTRMLLIPEIAATNERVVGAEIADIRDNQHVSIEKCSLCQRDGMVRLDPTTGISCWYCRHIPVDDAESMLPKDST